MNKEQKKKLYQLGLPIILGTILLLGVSYAWLSLTLTGTKTNVLKAGTLSLILDDELGSIIDLKNAVPILTEEGQMQEGYQFAIENNGDIPSQYVLYLDDVALDANEEKLSAQYIRYSLEKNNALVTPTGSALLSDLDNKILDNGIIGSGIKNTYTLRLWIDSEADQGAMNKVYKGKLRLEATQVQNSDSCFVSNLDTITKYNIVDRNGDPCSKEVVIPSNLNGTTITKIANGAFMNRGLTSVIIPNTITDIGTNAFAVNKISQLVIPDSVTNIGVAAFRDNQLPDDQAFIYNRKSDGSEDITTLNSYAGANRDHVVFPSNIKVISSFACNNLKLSSIVLQEGLTTIYGSAFSSNQLTSLTIPKTVTNLTGGAFSDNLLADEDAFIYKRSKEGEDRSYLINYAGARKENVVIPSNVETIGDSAFSTTNLKSVTIPEGVKYIGQRAFYNNKLTSITIPSSVTHIGMAAFNTNKIPYDELAFIYQRRSDGSIDDTTLLSYAGAKTTNIVVPENVTTIADGAFSYTSIESISLPSNLRTIGSYALENCNLSTIVIPSTVTSIGKNAFYKRFDTNSKLTNITNQTGKSFDWGLIINGSSGYNFTTGTVGNSAGNVSIVES